MADNETFVQAPVESVFDVLRDPASYSMWVVGCKNIRGVDADWPQPGSKLYHTVGFGPLQDHDTTEVWVIEPPSRLVLEGRVWPFGTAEIELLLRPHGEGTLLRMRETPRRGPAARLNNRAMELAIRMRNNWALRRLRHLSEQRHRATPGHLPE